jgi:hypothetical protein
MAGEANQVKWVGVRPTNPEEDLPVKQADKTKLLATVYPYVPVRPVGSTQVAKHNIATNSTVTIHTVTAGKTLYLCSIAFSIDNRAAAQAGGSFGVYNGAGALQYYFWIGSAPANDTKQASLSFNPPLELTAGWLIKVSSNLAAVDVLGFIHGYEV